MTLDAQAPHTRADRAKVEAMRRRLGAQLATYRTAAVISQPQLVVYPDEGHGLSRPHNIEHAIHAELAHYRAALGY